MFAIISGRVIGQVKESDYGYEFSIGEKLPKKKDGTYQNNVVRITVKDANDFVRKYAVPGNSVTVCASATTLKAALDKEGNPVTYQQMYANAAYVKLDFAQKDGDKGDTAGESKPAGKSRRAPDPIEDDIAF
jgi:hypothetical protein